MSTLRELYGVHEKKSHAGAVATLAPGDVSPVILAVDGRKYTAKREKGWAVALAKQIADDKTAPVRAAVREDSLELTTVLPGDPGNDVSLAGVGLNLPPRFTGGRTRFVAELLEWDGITGKSYILGERNTAAEALVIIRNKFMSLAQDVSRSEAKRQLPTRPPHKFRNFPPEEGCADCGRAKDDANHA